MSNQLLTSCIELAEFLLLINTQYTKEINGIELRYSLDGSSCYKSSMIPWVIDAGEFAWEQTYGNCWKYKYLINIDKIFEWGNSTWHEINNAELSELDTTLQIIHDELINLSSCRMILLDNRR